MHLAVDLVRGYALGDFDIGVVASTDTDLVPALEAVSDLDKRLGHAPVEVCAWFDQAYSKQLRVMSRQIYCDEFPRLLYDQVADLTNCDLRL